MRVVRELRPLSDGGGLVEYITFETNDELEREYEARLAKHLRDWNRARDIREYVAEIRAVLAENNYEPPDGGELDTWLEWCELQSSYDPIDRFRGDIATAAMKQRKEASEGGKRPRGRPRKPG